MKQSKVIQSFQGLRGYAIFVIFVSHCNLIYNREGMNILNWAGALGVSCFILLSGFLGVSQPAKSNLFSVLKKKIIKFYPLHIITLCAIIFLVDKQAMNMLYNRSGLTWAMLASNLTLTHALIPINKFYFSFNSVSWYLSLTVIFVCFTPLVAKIAEKLKKCSASVIALVFFSTVAIQFAWCFFIRPLPSAHYWIYICPIARLLDFILGAIVFVFVQKYGDKVKFKSVAVISAMLAILVLLILSMQTTSKFFCASLWSIPVAFLLGFLYLGNEDSWVVRAVFKNRVIVALGNISFELFLIHQVVIRFLELRCKQLGYSASLGCYVAAFVLSVILAYAVHVFKPIQRLKRLLKK